MNLLSYFRAQRKERTASTANVAKERLQILVAHERATRSGLEGGTVADGVSEELWRFTFSLSIFAR